MTLKANWANGEQFTAADANAVAEGVNNAYVKPGTGIPASDLASAVQTSLGKADSAVQSVASTNITDATTTGKSLLTATDASSARTTLGVAYGTTSGTVCQGNDSRLSPSSTSITDATTVGKALLTATDAATARTTLGVSYGTTSTTVCVGNDSRVTGAEQTSNKDANNGYAGLNSSAKLVLSKLATTGTADSTTYLRGDGAWSAVSGGFSRSVLTVSESTTLSAAANTDYVVFSNIPSGDFYYSNVTAVLAGEGNNNSTTITDGSPLAANWTAYGNAKVSTSQAKFGSSSIYFDGSGDYIMPTAAASNFQFGSSDWTVEMWIYCTAISGSYAFLLECRGGTNNNVPTIFLQNGALIYYANGGNQITDGSAISVNTWYHVAVSRVSGSTRMFKNGTQVGSTYTDSTNYTTDAVRMGCYYDNTSFGYTGFIDDIRFTKGVGRYSSNFTAPTAAFSTSSGGAITLPTASGNTNLYTLINKQSTSSLLATTSSQTIDGASSATLAGNATKRLISDGSNWYSA